MHTGTILGPGELNELIDDITRVFMHDVLTGSLVLSIVYRALMALKPQLIEQMKTDTEARDKFVEEVCDQIELEELENKILS